MSKVSCAYTLLISAVDTRHGRLNLVNGKVSHKLIVAER